MPRYCQIGMRVTAERDLESRALAKQLGVSLNALLNALVDEALGARATKGG